MKKLSAIILLFAVIFSIFTVFSCADPADGIPFEPGESGDGEPSGGDSPALDDEEGYFIDAPAFGLFYRAYPSGLCGTTNRSGMFRYRRGDRITFYVGTFAIGNPVMASRCISPLSIAGATTIRGSSPEAVLARNIIRFLMAMSTGLNPYGLYIPTTLGAWSGNLLSILCSPNFESLVVNVIASLRGLTPSEIVLPSVEAAENHFLISENLISQLEQNASKNLYASMKVPAVFSNSYVDVFYNRSGFAQGETSYTSGHKVFVGNNRNASFSARLDEGDWQLTLTAMQNNSSISVNDVIAFYTPEGFSPSPAQGYSLEMTEEKEFLHADLTNPNRSCVINEIHVLSGNVKIPAVLPDSTNVSDATGGSLRLFVDILDEDGDRAGSIMLMLPVPDGSEMTAEDGYITIPYSTTLADGYRYKVQIYYKPDTSKSYYVREAHTFSADFTADVSDENFNFDEWDR